MTVTRDGDGDGDNDGDNDGVLSYIMYDNTTLPVNMIAYNAAKSVLSAKELYLLADLAAY